MPGSFTIKEWRRDFVEKVHLNAGHLRRHPPYVGFVIIVLAALLTHSCEKTRMMQSLEMANLDAWVAAQKTVLVKDIILVEIDQDDYDVKTTFDRRSPLNKDEIKKLIGLIANAGASVVVVD